MNELAFQSCIDRQPRELALFAGAGGGLYAAQERGHRIVCAVERDAYAAQVLAQRQNDGIFPPFPIWSDVSTFDARPWRGIVDIISGGFPCQDISAAGKGAGIDGERSGLWAEFARIIRDICPRRVEVENSPMLTSRGLDRVLGDLAALGYDAQWGCLSAGDNGAPHIRERIWIVAYPNGLWELQPQGSESDQRGWPAYHCYEKNGSDTHGTQCQRERLAIGIPTQHADACGASVGQGIDINTDHHAWSPHARMGRQWRQEDHHGVPESRNWGLYWPAEPDVCRVVDGVAFGGDRLKALGNGQVPRVAQSAFHQLANFTE